MLFNFLGWHVFGACFGQFLDMSGTCLGHVEQITGVAFSRHICDAHKTEQQPNRYANLRISILLVQQHMIQRNVSNHMHVGYR